MTTETVRKLRNFSLICDLTMEKTMCNFPTSKYKSINLDAHPVILRRDANKSSSSSNECPIP